MKVSCNFPQKSFPTLNFQSSLFANEFGASRQSTRRIHIRDLIYHFLSVITEQSRQQFNVKFTVALELPMTVVSGTAASKPSSRSRAFHLNIASDDISFKVNKRLLQRVYFGATLKQSGERRKKCRKENSARDFYVYCAPAMRTFFPIQLSCLSHSKRN